MDSCTISGCSANSARFGTFNKFCPKANSVTQTFMGETQLSIELNSMIVKAELHQNRRKVYA